MKTISYITLGCKLNYAETSTYERRLNAEGFKAVPWSKGAEIFLVNTCTVTEHSDKKSRNIIRKLHRLSPKAAIYVTGCYAQLKKAEIEAIEGVTAVFGAEEKSMIVPRILADAHGCEPDYGTTGTFFPAYSSGERTRSFLKVQDGCDYYCSYCTIPKARGRSRSGTIESLVAQAREVAAEGGREIVITGVNIGDFGKNTGEKIIDLFRELDKIEGISRYRISSLEPDLLTDEIIEFVAQSRSFMPHFHIPLQSGSDPVLKLMRRHYDSALFAEKVNRIKACIPDAFIGVDLIVGARGESEEQFGISRDFVSALPVTRLHVFPYSERPGTLALTIDGVVDQHTKSVRAGVMINISEGKLKEFTQQFIGTVRPVLFEQPQKGKPMHGFTDNYIKVYAPFQKEYINRLALVRLCEMNEDCSVNGTVISGPDEL